MTEKNDSYSHIALSLSGGGFRAAGFHLGTLKALHKLGMLENVKILSTTSGGSITGLAYALCLSDDECISDKNYCDEEKRVLTTAERKFIAFEENLQDFLLETNVVDEALRKLSHISKINNRNPSPSPSLIRAAASVYNEKLFMGAKFGKIVKNSGHLEEISVNATDFTIGGSFRFQKGEKKQVLFGSKGDIKLSASIPNKKKPKGIKSTIARSIKKNVKKDLIDKIRLSDILAASSCFPGGFEPIRFPDDFYWQDDIESVWESYGKFKKKFETEFEPRFESEFKRQFEELFKKPTPLMDGGIIDNQGIGTLLTILDRAGNEEKVDFVLVSDSAGLSDSILDFEAQPNKGFLKIKYILRFFYFSSFLSLLVIVFFMTFIVFGLLQFTTISSGDFFLSNLFLSALILFFPLITLIGFVMKLYLVKKIERKTQGEFGGLSVIKDLNMTQLWRLLSSRLNSAYEMASNVFLDKIRSADYKMLYKSYRGKVVDNIIYDLIKSKDDGLITAKHRSLAVKAEAFPTNLWTPGETEKERKETLSNLVDCGEVTMYYNIYQFLDKKNRGDDKNPNGKLGSGQKELLKACKLKFGNFH